MKNIRDILGIVCVLAAFGCFMMIIGTAGGIETDAIPLDEGSKKMIIWLIASVAFAFSAKLLNGEDEREFE